MKTGMVHINDGTLNDEAIIPFGGMGDSGNGSRYGGEASLDTFTEWQWVTRARRAADLPVLIASDVASITDVARLAGVSTATVSRVVSSCAVRGQPGHARAGAGRGPGARLRPQRPGPRPAQEPRPGRRGHRPRHHRPVLLGGRARRRGRGRRSAATWSSPAARTGSPSASTRMSACFARCGRRRVIFAGSGLDDPASTTEVARHLAAMRAYGAAVVHLSPHAFGDAEIGVDNAAGIAGMVAALVELGHREIAFLAGPRVAVRVARDAWTATGAAWRRPGSRSTSDSS